MADSVITLANVSQIEIFRKKCQLIIEANTASLLCEAATQDGSEEAEISSCWSKLQSLCINSAVLHDVNEKQCCTIIIESLQNKMQSIARFLLFGCSRLAPQRQREISFLKNVISRGKEILASGFLELEADNLGEEEYIVMLGSSRDNNASGFLGDPVTQRVEGAVQDDLHKGPVEAAEYEVMQSCTDRLSATATKGRVGSESSVRSLANAGGLRPLHSSDSGGYEVVFLKERKTNADGAETGHETVSRALGDVDGIYAEIKTTALCDTRAHLGVTRSMRNRPVRLRSSVEGRPLPALPGADSSQCSRTSFTRNTSLTRNTPLKVIRTSRSCPNGFVLARTNASVSHTQQVFSGKVHKSDRDANASSRGGSEYDSLSRVDGGGVACENLPSPLQSPQTDHVYETFKDTPGFASARVNTTAFSRGPRCHPPLPPIPMSLAEKDSQGEEEHIYETFPETPGSDSGRSTSSTASSTLSPRHRTPPPSSSSSTREGGSASLPNHAFFNGNATFSQDTDKPRSPPIVLLKPSSGSTLKFVLPPQPQSAESSVSLDGVASEYMAPIVSKPATPTAGGVIPDSRTPHARASSQGSTSSTALVGKGMTASSTLSPRHSPPPPPLPSRGSLQSITPPEVGNVTRLFFEKVIDKLDSCECALSSDFPDDSQDLIQQQRQRESADAVVLRHPNAPRSKFQSRRQGWIFADYLSNEGAPILLTGIGSAAGKPTSPKREDSSEVNKPASALDQAKTRFVGRECFDSARTSNPIDIPGASTGRNARTSNSIDISGANTGKGNTECTYRRVGSTDASVDSGVDCGRYDLLSIFSRVVSEEEEEVMVSL